MIHRFLTLTGALAASLLLAGAAAAVPGSATGNVNMRTGPGTQYPVITTIPAGAPIDVQGCQSWCQVAFAGRQGYVSGSYVGTGYASAPPAVQGYYRPAPVYVAPPLVYVTPGPGYWRYPPRYYGRPYHWDRRPYWRHPRQGVHFGFGY